MAVNKTESPNDITQDSFDELIAKISDTSCDISVLDLSSLKIAGKRMEDNNMEKLTAALKDNQSIKTLNIKNANLTHEGLTFLKSIFPSNTSITSISLDEVPVNDQAYEKAKDYVINNPKSRKKSWTNEQAEVAKETLRTELENDTSNANIHSVLSKQKAIQQDYKNSRGKLEKLEKVMSLDTRSALKILQNLSKQSMTHDVKRLAAELTQEPIIAGNVKFNTFIQKVANNEISLEALNSNPSLDDFKTRKEFIQAALDGKRVDLVEKMNRLGKDVQKLNTPGVEGGSSLEIPKTKEEALKLIREHHFKSFNQTLNDVKQLASEIAESNLVKNDNNVKEYIHRVASNTVQEGDDQIRDRMNQRGGKLAADLARLEGLAKSLFNHQEQYELYAGFDDLKDLKEKIKTDLSAMAKIQLPLSQITDFHEKNYVPVINAIEEAVKTNLLKLEAQQVISQDHLTSRGGTLTSFKDKDKKVDATAGASHVSAERPKKEGPGV